jgi:hypothetical protein
MGIRDWWRNWRQAPDVQIPPIIAPEEMDEEDKESYREAARLEMQAALKLRDTITEQMLTSARWLQTSLLLLNAGAAAALLQTNHIELEHQTWAGTAFVVGALLALLQAYIGIQMTMDAPVKLSRAAGYWLSVSSSLFRWEEMEREFQEYSAQITRRARVPNAIGWLSIFCFACGCVIAARGAVA